MSIHLDHTLVSSPDKVAAGRLLAHLLDVPCGPAAAGPFFAVYVNEGLTLDFIDTDAPFEIHHYCFRVSDRDFDAILGRIKAAGIAYRSSVRGAMDLQICTDYGGRSVYWNQPDGHQWEMLTASYARAPA